MPEPADPFVYLCESVFGVDQLVNLDLLNVFEKTFFLVEHTRGLVLNSGFVSYFSAETPGDSDYRLSMVAYFEIGAVRAAAIYSRAVRVALAARETQKEPGRDIHFSPDELEELRESDVLFEGVQGEIDGSLDLWLSRYSKQICTLG